MHGVSEVIAIILILMITISLAGLAYMFMTTTMSNVTASAGSTVDTTTTSMLTSFTIESVYSNIVYVRNTGQNPLSSLSVYVNDIPIQVNMTPASITPGGVASLAIIGFVKEGDTIKVTSPSGFSYTKTAPDQCYGAIACWRFDEENTTVSHDLVGTNDGTIYGSPVFVSSRYGTGLQLNGIDDYVSTGKMADIDMDRTLSVSFWIKGSIQTSYYPGIVYKRGTYGWGVFVSSYGPGIYVRIDTTGGSNQCTAPLNALDDQWHYAVFTFDKGRILGYLDATKIFNSTYNEGEGFDSLSYNFMIDGRHFNGTIDDVMIWDHALSDGEISAIYEKAAY